MKDKVKIKGKYIGKGKDNCKAKVKLKAKAKVKINAKINTQHIPTHTHCTNYTKAIHTHNTYTHI